MFSKTKLLILLTTVGLSSCQAIDAVIAQGSGELTFETQNQWDYAAKVAPDELIQQVRKENIADNWIGDPRRFSMIKVQYMGQKYPLYLVIPSVDCESDYCPMELHLPLCGNGGKCSYFVYMDKDGEYKKVWGKLFYNEGATPLFKVSRQMKDGVPACLEMGGLDWETSMERDIEIIENKVFRSRYCFNGEEYVLTQFDRIPAPPVKNR